MATPILGITTVATNQTQKEAVINDGFVSLEKAGNDLLAVDLTSSDVTLTDTEFREAVYFYCDGHSVARELIVPAIKRLFIVQNDGTETLTVKLAASTGVDMVSGTRMVFYNDTTEVYEFGIAGVTGGLANMDIKESGSLVANATTINFIDLFSVTDAGGGQVNVSVSGIQAPLRVFAYGEFQSNEMLAGGYVIDAFTIPADFGDTDGYMEVAPFDGSFTLTLLKNNSAVGSIVWNLGSNTISSMSTSGGSPVSFTTGDRWAVRAQSSPDAQAANMFLAIRIEV